MSRKLASFSIKKSLVWLLLAVLTLNSFPIPSFALPETGGPTAQRSAAEMFAEATRNYVPGQWLDLSTRINSMVTSAPFNDLDPLVMSQSPGFDIEPLKSKISEMISDSNADKMQVAAASLIVGSITDPEGFQEQIERLRGDADVSAHPSRQEAGDALERLGQNETVRAALTHLAGSHDFGRAFDGLRQISGASITKATAVPLAPLISGAAMAAGGIGDAESGQIHPIGLARPGASGLRLMRGIPRPPTASSIRRLTESFESSMDSHHLIGGRELSAGRRLGARILRNLKEDLISMANEVDHDPNVYQYVFATAAAALDSWADHVDSSRVNSFARLTLHQDDTVYDPVPRQIMVNFYAIGADPMHLGHLLIGLNAMAAFPADFTIFVPAGADGRKPDLVKRAQSRHDMVKAVVNRFYGLFRYSPLALGTQYDGETNFFRFLQMNHPRQTILARYIVGDDHLNWISAKNGLPDTRPKLKKHYEEAGFTLNDPFRRIRAVFISRQHSEDEFEEEIEAMPERRLPFPVSFIKDIRYDISSTLAREFKDYSLIPWPAFTIARDLGLYRIPPVIIKP